MIITPKSDNCIFEIIEEDEDLINLVDGNTYFRVWKNGEFQVDRTPDEKPDGSVILSVDSIVRVSENTETNVAIDFESEEELEKFWKTHTVSHYIIKGGYNVEKD